MQNQQMSRGKQNIQRVFSIAASIIKKLLLQQKYNSNKKTSEFFITLEVFQICDNIYV